MNNLGAITKSSSEASILAQQLFESGEQTQTRRKVLSELLEEISNLQNLATLGQIR